MLPFPHDGSLLMKPTSSGGAEMYTERATPGPPASPPAPAHVLARKVWAAFAFTFVLSRILVFLIMSGRMPDIHSHFRGTHLHHLNYGIFLLAAVGAVLLFRRPTGRWLSATAILYGWDSPSRSTSSGCGCTSTRITGSGPASTPWW